MDDATRAEAKYVLSLFNERAAELDTSRWMTSMRAGKGSYNIKWNIGMGTIVTHDMPHPEEMKAFALTYRLFFEKNEPFSFRRLRMLYPKLDCVSAELRVEALDLIEHVNRYFDSKDGLIMSREPVTRRHVQDVYLFGGLIHSNSRDKKEIMGTWRAREDLEVMIEAHFADIALDLTQKAIFKMRRLNLRAIEELTQPGEQGSQEHD